MDLSQRVGYSEAEFNSRVAFGVDPLDSSDMEIASHAERNLVSRGATANSIQLQPFPQLNKPLLQLPSFSRETRIVLVRHGESEANVDPNLYTKVPDYVVWLL